MRIKDPEIRLLNRIVTLIGKAWPVLSPAGRQWLYQRLIAVELRHERF